MEGDHWPRGLCGNAGAGLARLRKRASEFFERLSVAELAHEAHRHLWVSDWMRLSDEYRMAAEAARDDGFVQVAHEARLCSLTSFEVARNLTCRADRADVDLADDVGSSQSRFEADLDDTIEHVQLDCDDQEPLSGFFLPASRRDSAAPAIICIGDGEITRGSMMTRLLPASLGRNMSLLFLDAGDSRARRVFKQEHILQCWMDHLLARTDVDPQRIAVYGEGAGAGCASRVALSDRRVAAAVCDGDLVTSVRRRASVRWMTGIEQACHDATETLPPPRRISCPLLIVVGERSMVREEEALELQAGYRQAGADCSVVVPNRIPSPLGEVENFIAVDDFIFEWFGAKLGSAPQPDPLTRL
ncbi:alpha/beta hydrolase [Bradyrhizobium sp.]|uniref:alpha/beta hydrolase n=1 Tax=Bradyrhizobium sp. TaxID=376 RepID=UPI0039E65AFF